MRRLISLALVGLILGGLAVTVQAATETKTYKGTVTLRATSSSPGQNAMTTFEGKVTANGGCQAKRSVIVSSSYQDLGATRTDSSGRYELSTLVDPGDGPFVANLAKRSFRKQGVLRKCFRAKSAPVTLPDG